MAEGALPSLLLCTGEAIKNALLTYEGTYIEYDGVEDFKIRLVTNNECVNDSTENSFEYDGTEIIGNNLDLATIVLNEK